ncbi:MAG: UDP-N-acetylmuramate dehydrogenase [Burkholderiales bacterium]
MADTERMSNPVLRGQLRAGELMRRHTSWRVGGPVDCCYTPADLDDLCVFLRLRPENEALTFVGLGSNLLVRDGGIRGTVIFTHSALNRLQLDPIGEVTEVYAEAGVATPKVARFAATHGFEGAEFLAGIPGTVGGSLAMNAGCYGTETWEIVSRVLMVDRRGNRVKRDPAEFRIAYRSVRSAPPREEFFAAGWFRLTKGDGHRSRLRIKELLQRRIASQPLEQSNAGSVFRNPPGDYAARLIESCGMKGLRCGGAMVSPKHANFIINLGDASANDIETLIGCVQKKVKREFGVELEREVRIVGDNVAGEGN